jgi:hypothetical protein
MPLTVYSEEWHEGTSMIDYEGTTMIRNPPRFKMLFRDELFTLEDVMKAAEKNPDILWVIYEAAPGTYNTDKFVSMGKMPAGDIVTKYG